MFWRLQNNNNNNNNNNNQSLKVVPRPSSGDDGPFHSFLASEFLTENRMRMWIEQGSFPDSVHVSLQLCTNFTSWNLKLPTKSSDTSPFQTVHFLSLTNALDSCFLTSAFHQKGRRNNQASLPQKIKTKLCCKCNLTWPWACGTSWQSPQLCCPPPIDIHRWGPVGTLCAICLSFTALEAPTTHSSTHWKCRACSGSTRTRVH